MGVPVDRGVLVKKLGGRRAVQPPARPTPEDPQMSTLTRSLRTFARSEEGATTAEYGIIIVVVAGIAIFVLASLNNALNTLYGKFNTKVANVN